MNASPAGRTRAPALQELLLSMDEDGRREGASCAVILPFHEEIDCVRRHLQLLEKQEDQDFDVILVTASSLPQPKAIPGPGAGRFGTVSLRLKEPLGAGAFYVGQRYAFEKGYEILVLADADAFPEDRTLLGRLKAAAFSEHGAIHLPSIASARGPRRSPSIHWYGAMHADAIARSGFTFLPLYFGGVDDELESRLESAGVAVRRLAGVSVSHALFKQMPQDAALARALNDIRNRGPQLFSFPLRRQPLMPLYSAFSMLTFFGRTGSMAPKMRLALRALSSAIAGSSSAHFKKSDAGMPPFPGCALEGSLDFAKCAPMKAFVLCPEIGDAPSSGFENQCLKRGILTSRIPFGEGGSPISYSFALLCGPFVSGSAIVFSDWRLAFNPLLLLYRRAYLHDGGGTWLLHDTPGVLERLGKCALSCLAFSALASAYIPASLIAWLGAHRSRLRYGVDKNE